MWENNTYANDTHLSFYRKYNTKKEVEKMKIIAIDVDGVCADTHEVWLDKYNREYGDNLTFENITTLDMHTLVKPECGREIYKYIENPTIYDDVKPVKGAIARINVLRWYFRIIFVTTSTLGASGKKLRWLKENNFLQYNRDYFECEDKSLVFSHYLIDDDIKNIQKPVPYGKRINVLFTRPWNKDFRYKNRLNSWYASFDFES